MTADGIAFSPPNGDRMLFRGNLGRDIGLFTARTDGSDLITLIPPFDARLCSTDTDLVPPTVRWSPSCEIRSIRRMAARWRSPGTP